MILVGEIRDLETAETAIQASLTGHLVFSTLHTNDAPSAFTRLIDMGVEPFLVSQHGRGRDGPAAGADHLPGVQDDVRPTDDAATSHRTDGAGRTSPQGSTQMTASRADDAVEGRRAAGRAGNTGFRGRTGIHELLVNNDVIKDLIVQRVNAGVIRLEALKAGMITLRQDGWRKVLQRHDDDRRGRPATTAGDISYGCTVARAQTT